jgi:hypothetical protein
MRKPPRKSPRTVDLRQHARQIRMTDALHAAAVEAATSEHTSFSDYVRSLVEADLARREIRRAAARSASLAGR